MKNYLFIFLLFSPFFLFAQEEELSRCVYFDRPLSPSEQLQIEQLNKMAALRQENASLRTEASTYFVPVVFHIVYNLNSEYVSYDQVLTQLDVLNQDYTKQNADTSLTPAPFKPLAADANIQFVLAKQDPQGMPTSGITYTKTTASSFSYTSDYVKNTSNGGKTAWNPNQYLNVWVCNLSGGVLGYVPSPIPFGSPMDGVVISYRAFGTIGKNISQYFNKGRTATHEIGHYFGLYHPWGKPSAAYCTTDEVDDTPVQASETDYHPSTCPVFPYVDKAPCSNAPNGRLFSNFMDYTRDNCMTIFTKGQVKKMQDTLVMKRFSLLTSKGLQRPFNKDLALLDVNFDTSAFCKNLMTSPKLRIRNGGSDTIFEFNAKVVVNGVSDTKNWKGVLLPDKDTLLVFSGFSNSSENNLLEAGVELSNPLKDEYPKNDSMTASFGCSTALSIYPNPATEMIFIKGNTPLIVLATFYSLEGKEILKIDYPKDIDVSSLQPGSYLVVFETDTKTIRQQFIVIH